mgnify:CR=1 FL=1
MRRTAVEVDEARVEELVGQLAGHMTGAAICLSIWLGDELGYYRALATSGAVGSDALAAQTGCNPRLTREWLDSQAAGGLVAWDAETDTYALTAVNLLGTTWPVLRFWDRFRIAEAVRRAQDHLGDGLPGWPACHTVTSRPRLPPMIFAWSSTDRCDSALT